MIELVGYHGTLKENIESILKDGFKAKNRDDHWLGQGIYFFPDIERAKWWSQGDDKKKKKDPSIVKVIIRVQKEKYLNLDKKEDYDKFIEYTYAVLKETEFDMYFDSNNEYKNLCFCLDLVKEHKNISVVSNTFEKKNTKYAKNFNLLNEINFYFPNGVGYKEEQICTADNTTIVEKFVIND